MPRIDRLEIMDYAFEYAVKSGLDGHYLEFGVFEGASFVAAYQAYRKWLAWADAIRHGLHAKMIPPHAPKLQPRLMFAFDSFAGLPEIEGRDQLPGYDFVSQGAFQSSEAQFLTNLEKGGVDLSWVRAVPGFFDRSLQAGSSPQLDFVGPAAVVNIDCDLYSSSVPVFEFISPYLVDGAILLIDDFGLFRYRADRGVQQALWEWQQKSGWLVTPYEKYGWAGASFIVHRPEVTD